MAAMRLLKSVVMACTAAVLVAGPVVAEAKPVRRFVLDPGESVFWTGKTTDPADHCVETSCSSYRIEVTDRAERLRVAIEDGDLDFASDYRIQLIDPSGKAPVTSEIETFAIEPAPGTWRVNVLPIDGAEGSFSLRAKLEDRQMRQPMNALQRPNLRPEPGYDFTFSWPEAACGAYAVEDCAGISPAPVPPSCAPDETPDDGAARCLRFSMGYQNAGDGPLDLHFGAFDAAERSVEVTQWVYRANQSESFEDNKHVEVDAGTARYHEIHGHFHYDNIFGAELFSVDPETHELTRLGDVAKRGACAHDYVLVDFERFYQDRQHLADSGSDCSFLLTNPNAEGGRIGLSTGWADIYTAELSDNYVDFGINLDGHYLLRFYVDIDDTIVETNERDNVGYSYIEVSGLDVELLERGRGTDPWDPKKVVADGLGD